MRRYYPGTRSLIVSTMLYMLPAFANASDNTQEQMVAEGISTTYLEQNLQTHRTQYLGQMLNSPEKRLEYVKSLYTSQMLEQAIVENGLDQSQPLMEALRNARSNVLLDTLIAYEFRQIDEDLEALARERFEAKPELYWARKRIKIALIFVQKHDGIEDQAKLEIEEIAAQLDEQPESDRLFYQLAEKHSDDARADQGGAIRKWLIAPADLEKSPPIYQAAYALEIPGQRTEILESKLGFSIVRLLKVVPARKLSFTESKPEIMAHIISQLKGRKKAEVMQSLQADDDLLIDDEAVREMVSALYTTRKSETPGK